MGQQPSAVWPGAADQAELDDTPYATRTTLRLSVAATPSVTRLYPCVLGESALVVSAGVMSSLPSSEGTAGTQ